MIMDDVAARLRSLEKDTGQLLEDDVIADARNLTSPLHQFFEWDDTKAAAEHRRAQARQLIRRVHIEVTVKDVPLSVVRYVRDNASGESGTYRDILKVRPEKELARQVVLDEMERVAKAAKRAKAVAAVLGIADDIKAIEDLANGAVERVSLENPPAGAA